MPRNLRYGVLTAGAAALLAQPALIQSALAQSAHQYHAHRGYYHRYYLSEYQRQLYVQATIAGGLPFPLLRSVRRLL